MKLDLGLRLGRKARQLEEKPDDDKKPPLPWNSYLFKQPSPRFGRRIEAQRRTRVSRAFNRRNHLEWHANRRAQERSAVKVLRAYEFSLGLKSGELARSLMDDEKLEAGAHTPHAVLLAAGLTPEALQELLEAEQLDNLLEPIEDEIEEAS